jgi:hypothetical protein
MGLPLAVSEHTFKIFDIVDDVPAGGRVLIATGIFAGTEPDIVPGWMILTNHLVDKEDIKLYIVDVMTGVGASQTEKFMNRISKIGSGEKEYGEDWVNLGYVPGGITAVTTFGSDINAIVKSDFYGTPLGQIPMMEGINSIPDFDLIITVGEPHGPLEQWGNINIGYKVHHVYVCPTMAIPGAMLSLYAPGGWEAAILGIQGAAEYEVHIKKPGLAVVGNDARTLQIFYAVGLIIAGNVIFFWKRREK